MRLDKFLKVSRLIKRRTLAKQVADQGRITINGKVAKASSVVKETDELAIRFGQKIVTVKINLLKESTKKEDATSMYTILKEEKLEKVELEFVDDED
ncbi:RNA-binding S4 domain-containing protein [Sporosarcina sp. NPDC096371]|uniref:RNA-binding S4 domain-containing protein n=1 Tax=Sporosarcina sp. NPDC096371 TaxID=3364530 RepID=UPI00381F54CB